MLKALLARAHQGHRTMALSGGRAPGAARAVPRARPRSTPRSVRTAAGPAPTSARRTRSRRDGPLALDLGRCLFCTACVEACPEGAVAFTHDYRLATRRREDLVARGEERALADALDRKLRRLFGRSLKLRVVSAGDCNACSADVNVLGTIGWDLGRFGIDFVASPRHADGLLVTGPVTENMRLALQKTYDAVPPPKIVIAVGACAISGGPYAGHPEQHGGASSVRPGRPLHPGLPAASAHDSRRAAPAARADRGATASAPGMSRRIGGW